MLELVQNKLRLKNRPKCLLKSFVFFLHQGHLIFLLFVLSFIVALHCSSYWSSKSCEEKVRQLWQRDWTRLWRQQEGQHWLFDVFIQWVCIYILLLVVEYCTIWTGTVPHLYGLEIIIGPYASVSKEGLHVVQSLSYLVLFSMSYEYELLYGGCCCCCCCCCLFWGTIIGLTVTVWDMGYCMVDVLLLLLLLLLLLFGSEYMRWATVWQMFLLLSVGLFGEGIMNYHEILTLWHVD